jgi:exopolysaccharide biosynthesis polyprenyl glycosylphosphotransferase
MRPSVSTHTAEGADSLPRLVLRRRRRPRTIDHARLVARRHGPRDVTVRRMLALSDIAALTLSFATIWLLFNGHPGRFFWALLTLPAWVVIFKAYGLYDRDVKRISHLSLDDLPWIFHAVLVGSLLLYGYYRVIPPGGIVFADLVLFDVVAIIGVAGMRALVRRLAVRLLEPERVLLVGEGPEITALARKMNAHPEYGVEPVGLVSPSPELAERSQIPALGDLVDFELPQVVAEHRVERLVIAHRTFGEVAMLELLRASRELRLKVSVLPRLFDALGPSVEIDDVEGLTVLGVNPPVLARSSRFLKRTMDVAGAGLLLFLAAPFLVMIMIAIKLDSKGPVFFRQQRVGKRAQGFQLIKFRTMVVDAEDRREELLALSKDPGWLLLEHDPRITRLGRFLRKWSLDELPQLWNVVKGDMSLVGPRPLIESEHRQLSGWGESRLDLTPGLTGLWQVLGRTKIPFEEMVKLDYLYVANWSLWTDVRLILRTLPAVLTSRGAN